MSKIIIAGSRHLIVSNAFISELMKQFDIYPTEIVSGGAKGIDSCGEEWANHMNIPIQPFYVTEEEWDTLGLAAGPIRNKKMAKYGDKLLLIWDGMSKGSRNMREEMLKQQKNVYEIIIKQKRIAW